MADMNQARELVLAYSQKLVEEGYLKGTGGNLSIRIGGEEQLAITPSNKDYTTLSADEICIYDFNQEIVDSVHKPSIEMGFHIAVYQARPDVGCVVHTHQAMASAVSLINKSIPALFDEQVRFLGRSVKLVPYAPSGTGMLVKNIQKTVDDKHNAYIMKNHGALVFGADAQQAYHNALLLEKAATAFILALASEAKVKNIPLAIREIAFQKLRKEQKKIEQELSAL